MDIIIGSLIAAAWAGVVLWSAVRIGAAAGRRQLLGPASYIVGMLGTAMLTAGLVLIFRKSLPDDVFGAGALLAGAGTLAVWCVARATEPDRQPTFFDDPIFTDEGAVRPPIPKGPEHGDGAPR
jgi:hypothetical protein